MLEFQLRTALLDCISPTDCYNVYTSHFCVSFIFTWFSLPSRLTFEMRFFEVTSRMWQRASFFESSFFSRLTKICFIYSSVEALFYERNWFTLCFHVSFNVVLNGDFTEAFLQPIKIFKALKDRSRRFQVVTQFSSHKLHFIVQHNTCWYGVSSWGNWK